MSAETDHDDAPRCRLCHHPLSAPRSITLGIGPVCRRHVVVVDLPGVLVAAWAGPDGARVAIARGGAS